MNTFRILEVSWLVICLAGAGLFIYNLIADGLVAAVWPLVITVVAGAFYFVRRKQRISYSRQQADPNQTAE